MPYVHSILDAKMLFLRTGYCDHKIEFRVTSHPRGTNVTLINCGVCGKEYGRTNHTQT